MNNRDVIQGAANSRRSDDDILNPRCAHTILDFPAFFLLQAVRVKERDERNENMLMKNIHEFAEPNSQASVQVKSRNYERNKH